MQKAWLCDVCGRGVGVDAGGVRAHTHTHTHTPVDGTSMNEECEAVMVDHQVCAMRFLA